MKVIIVGGVAGGASCAARLRRLDERVEILMVERGPYVSYANCGLPYYVGGIIEKESSLLVADANTFRSQFAVDVSIDPGRLEPGTDIHAIIHDQVASVTPLTWQQTATTDWTPAGQARLPRPGMGD